MNLNKGLLKHNIRTAPKITREELIQLMRERRFSLDNIKSELLKDITFGFDNIFRSRTQMEGFRYAEQEAVGIHTLDNGFTFHGFFSGTDEEVPIFYIMYWDGKAFRGYIPKCGNFVNMDFETTFGGERWTEKKDFYEVMKLPKYKNFFSKFDLEEIEDDMHEAELFFMPYLLGEGLSQEEATKMIQEDTLFNYDAIIEDIKSAIKID